MANIIEADVIQKIATEAEWLTQTRIPYKGQIMIVSDSSGKVTNIKVGDGVNPYSGLSYMFDSIQQNVGYIAITSNALPTPLDDVAWGMVTGGTYTFGGSDVFTVPVGHWGIANYSSGSWSLVDMGELPKQPLANVVNQDTDKAITPKGVYDTIIQIADAPTPIPFTLVRGYFNTAKTFVSDSGGTQKYLSTNLIPISGGVTISLRGYKKGSLSSAAQIKVWVGDDLTNINIGLTDEYTYTTPVGTTEISILVAHEITGSSPEPFRDTFQLVEGTDFNFKLKVDKEFILSKVDANDFFKITPNLPVIFDSNKPFENFRVILESGDVQVSASNNLTFERAEVIGGELISTSPIRAFAEYDSNDEFIPDTWKGSTSNFQSYTFNLNPNTKYVRATVPQDGGAGITSNLNGFKVIYGDASELEKPLVYDLKTIGGGNINVFSADNAEGSGGSVAEETLKNNESQNSIIKDIVENQQMVKSLLALKGSNSVDQNITITGKSEALNNHVQRLHVHFGSQEGDVQFDEVFMNGTCKEDFSDLRFFDEDGNNLDFVVHSYGNYEVIKDNATLLNNTVQYTSDGKLIMSHSSSGASRSLRISSDNGASWTILHADLMLLYVDSRDNVFVFRQSNFKMFMLLQSESYATLHEVLDLSYSQSDIRPLAGFCEDQNGHLYCGKYQGARDVEIFKSTDQGVTWTTVYRDLVNNQHVHHISFDKFTNTLYAGLDGAKNYLDPIRRAKNIKSTDGGATWTVVPNPYPNSDYGLAFYGDGYRLGFGETSILGGPTIYKTFDDVNYYPVLNTNQGIRKIVEIDGVLFAGGNAGQAHRNAQIYMSKDEGETWKTIFWEDWQNTSSAGDAVRYFSYHQTPMGATEPQTIIGGNGAYSRLRLFHGGNHHQALVFVKVGSLPMTGRTIKVSTDYTITYPSRSVESEFVSNSLKGSLLLNEGRGTSMFDKVSESFISGNVEWQDDVRRFNSPYSFHRRDYLPAGIRLIDGTLRLPANFNLPQKNFSLAFFANFFGEYSAEKKFLFGDPDGIHFYYQNSGIYVSNGVNNYVCYGLEVPLIQDFYNFYVLTVTNDATPVFNFTIGDNQFLSRPMTTWANKPSSESYLLGSGGAGFSKSNVKIHSVMVFDNALTDAQAREIYFGQSVI